jgi:hypothetical protein
MLGDRVVAQKQLFTSSASIGMSPRTICTVQEFRLIVEIRAPQWFCATIERRNWPI